jgi:hypothetical protein
MNDRRLTQGTTSYGLSRFISTLIRLTLIAGILIFSQHAMLAQTNRQPDRQTDKQELQRLAERYAAEFAEKKAEAQRLARENGWVVREETPDGRIIDIMEIGPNGKPEYNTTFNLNAARTTGTDELWTGGGSGLNLTGAGFTIAEWDGGGVRTSHQEFRVGTGPSRVTQKDSPASTSYHSTHVAGTLIAEGQVNAAHGMAPSAELHAYDWDNDVSEMLSANSVDDIILSNHSYGRVRGWDSYGGNMYWHGDIGISTTEDYEFGFYGQLTKTWDSLAYAMQDFLFVKSAGNDRNDDHSGGHYVWSGGGWAWSTASRDPDGGTDGYDCIGNRGVGKNLLTVGAVNDIPGGYTQPSDVTMTAFSGWGPTDDGRIKPDIVANGMDLYSTDDDHDSDYTTLPGTSMSSPNVCGTLALLQDYHYDIMGTYMWADELKALVINTAHEAGPDPGPDYQFGWGLLNAEGAAELITLENSEGGHINYYNLTNGSTNEHFYYCDGTDDINVTIVWIDPPHSALTPSLNPSTYHLVNDLNLRVIELSDGTTTEPWTRHPSSPGGAAYTFDNYRDNVEKVTVFSPDEGPYKLTISHDGTLASTQTYALVVSGLRPPTSGSWCGITSTDWNTQSNWEDFEVPTASDNVVIPSGCTYYPVLNGTFGVNYSSTYNCNSLTVNSGASLTLNGTDLRCAGNLDVNGIIYVGNDAYLYNGTVMDLSGSFYTGYSTGWYGDLSLYSGATINQTGGYLYTENAILNSGCQYNGTGGYFYLSANGDAPATQFIEIDDPDSYFHRFYIGSGVNAQMTSSTYDLECDAFAHYGNFTTGSHTIQCDYFDSWVGTLTINGGTVNVAENGPYFHSGSTLLMNSGSLTTELSIKFLSGSSENVSGGNIYCNQNFYNEYGVFTPTGGAVRFIGSDTSDIKGATQFHNLYINKTTSSYNAVENGSHNNGVDITVNGVLHILDGSLELNSPCTLAVTGNIEIDIGAELNANDSPDIYIQASGSWFDDNAFGGLDAGSYSIVEFNGPGPGIPIVRENGDFNDIIINSTSSYVRPDVTTGYQLIWADNIDITTGALKVAGCTVDVEQDLTIHGQLIMDNSNDTLFVDNIIWKSGSTDNITNGRIIVNGDWTWENGTLANIASGNTAEFKNSATGFIYCMDPNAYFYNLLINKSGGSVWIHTTTTEPVRVNNDVDVITSSLFHVQVDPLDVNGDMTVTNGSTVRLYSAGSVEVDDDLTIDGYMELSGGGTVDVHGSLSLTSTGHLEMDDGTFTVDLPHSSPRSIIYLDGTLTMADGIFEISNNHLWLSSTFAENVSGGTIRVGGTFYASSGVFTPTGGTLELMNYGGTSGYPYIQLNSGNHLHNLVLDHNYTWLIGSGGASTLTINQDLTINDGTLNGSNDDIYIGDDWINNIGNSGFTSGTGHVYLTGSNASPDMQVVAGTNTFYNLTNQNTNSVVEFAGQTTITNNYDAGNGGAACETFITGTPIDIQNQLILDQGVLALSASAPTVTADYFVQGGTLQVTNGSFTANDLTEKYLEGDYTLYNGTINLHQDAGQRVDINADITINNGTFNIHGGTGGSVHWPYIGGSASLAMSGGTLDIKDLGIYFYNNSFTENITGGLIRSSGFLNCNSGVTFFTPSGGTMELYGSSNATLNLQPGNHFHNFWSSKNPGSYITASSDMDIKGELKVTSGEFRAGFHNINVGP